MPEPTRTLLSELIPVRNPTPDQVSYQITANRLVAMGGFECNRVEARVLDSHYLLMRADTVNGFDYEPFGIAEMDEVQDALVRLYSEAQRLATVRALSDGNHVIDLTSRANKVKGDDAHFVPIQYLDRCA